MKKILLYSLCLFLLGACQRHDQGWENEAYPIILPGTPTNNQVFSAGETANIVANIYDNQGGLVKVNVHIYNNVTGQLLTDIQRTPNDGKYYFLDESLQVQAGTQYKIEIVAINKDSRQAKETVLISAN
jgi:hypothetical protein